MKKRARLMLLMLAGVLVYFAAEKESVASCIPECWDAGWGRTCCTDANCFDYCF
jgi:hypothetical protein